MFACLYSLSAPLAALVKLAEDFTPRFEVVGPLVMLDVSGLARLFGSPREIGEQLRRSSTAPLRIALAPTQTAAALLALGRPGLTVVLTGEQGAALSSLPVSLLADFERLRLSRHAPPPAPGVASSPAIVQDADLGGTRTSTPAPTPPSVSDFEDTLPYFQQSVMDRASHAAIAMHCGGGGWAHPRQSHAANATRRARRPVTATRDTEHPHAAGPIDVAANSVARNSVAGNTDRSRRTDAAESVEGTTRLVSKARIAPAAVKAAAADIQAVMDTLRRWGVKTCGALAALPAGEVYERLGARGVLWQRLVRGEDTSPLVPWVPEDPFEASLDLEWPIEGLEPLSFVLGRLFDPLAERLERADRGAAIIHTHLRLVNKEGHARMLQLPAPMRDPKTLRTLVLLDLESHPPSAGVDRVRVLVEPTPARVIQWALFERAQPSAEQVSTLLARLTALMGDGHVGSPRLLDTWKPGAFELSAFAPSEPDASRRRDMSTVAPSAFAPPDVRDAGLQRGRPGPSRDGADATTPAAALRRFRIPVPARVRVEDGRPARVMTDRRGVSGGTVVQSAGPWRTSGEWWNDATPGQAWDRDEWDVALSDGTIYRVYVERDAGQWFIEGVLD